MGGYTAGDMRYTESDGADSVTRKGTQGPVYQSKNLAPCQFDVIPLECIALVPSFDPHPLLLYRPASTFGTSGAGSDH